MNHAGDADTRDLRRRGQNTGTEFRPPCSPAPNEVVPPLAPGLLAPPKRWHRRSPAAPRPPCVARRASSPPDRELHRIVRTTGCCRPNEAAALRLKPEHYVAGAGDLATTFASPTGPARK